MTQYNACLKFTSCNIIIANNSSANFKLSKIQLHKIGQQDF